MPTSPRPIFPRGPLLAVGGILLASVVLAGAGRLTGPTGTPPKAELVVARDIRFEDRADGGVDIFSGRNPTAVEVVAPTTDNFLRATMRTLVRERRRQSIGAEQPFHLAQWADGRLTLDDFATGRHIELAAFGETNEAVFAQVLVAAAKLP